MKFLHVYPTVFTLGPLLQWQHSADGRQLPCPQTTEAPAASVPESLLSHPHRCSDVSSPAVVPVSATLEWLCFRGPNGTCHISSDLGKTFPMLSLLDVFGLVNDSHLPSLKKEIPRICINSRPFSNIARPTPASRLIGSCSDRTMWNRKCQLRFKL